MIDTHIDTTLHESTSKYRSGSKGQTPTLTRKPSMRWVVCHATHPWLCRSGAIVCSEGIQTFTRGDEDIEGSSHSATAAAAAAAASNADSGNVDAYRYGLASHILDKAHSQLSVPPHFIICYTIVTLNIKGFAPGLQECPSPRRLSPVESGWHLLLSCRRYAHTT